MPSKPTAEELERLHHRQGRSTYAIAAIYNVWQFDVCNWLAEYAIDRRSDDANIKDWEKIRLARKDNSEFTLHLTDSLDTLKEILGCGYLKPARGPRWSHTTGIRQDTIKGPYPAVCFTAQTLGDLCETFANFGGRFFFPYGIAFNKTSLYEYGARPVVYGDEAIFHALPADWQYLWAKYDPLPDSSLGGYPRDFLHEREWRCRPSRRRTASVSWDIDAVPILLPRDLEWSAANAPFVLLVFRESDADDLRQWLGRGGRESEHEWLRRYFTLLPEAKVVVFEEVSRGV